MELSGAENDGGYSQPLPVDSGQVAKPLRTEGTSRLTRPFFFVVTLLKGREFERCFFPFPLSCLYLQHRWGVQKGNSLVSKPTQLSGVQNRMEVAMFDAQRGEWQGGLFKTHLLLSISVAAKISLKVNVALMLLAADLPSYHPTLQVCIQAAICKINWGCSWNSPLNPSVEFGIYFIWAAFVPEMPPVF